MLLPDHERALGAQHVLLPPNLTKIIARDASPRLRCRLDLAQVYGIADHCQPVGCREMTRLFSGPKQCGGRKDAVGCGNPACDLRLASAAVVGIGVAGEPGALQFCGCRVLDRTGRTEACNIGRGDASCPRAQPRHPIGGVGDNARGEFRVHPLTLTSATPARGPATPSRDRRTQRARPRSLRRHAGGSTRRASIW